MKIEKESLLKLFNTGTNQYVIPFFQRAYVWKIEDCENLYNDLINTYKAGLINPKKEHFIGTIITKNSNSSSQMNAQYELVDGQQRMTTFSLLIKALANSVDLTIENGNHLFDNINNILYHKDAYGKVHYRIIHNRLDKKNYDLIMESNGNMDEIMDKNNKLVAAYLLFREKFKGLSNEQILNYNLTILNKFPAINMILENHDDEQEIFDTINSLGVKLTTSELLKNYVFNDDQTKELYKTYWEDIFESDEETVRFWNIKKTAGRIYRENIDVLLYCFLLIEQVDDISLEYLFRNYKDWLKEKDFEEKKQFLESLKTFADIYSNLPSGMELHNIKFIENEKRFFHIIENLNITTVFPLVLFIYKSTENKTEREKCLLLLESFIVRRAVCKLNTKNYNNLFISFINQLQANKETSISESLKDILLSYTEDSSKFPSNEEFINGIENSILSNQHSKEILFVISLFQINTVLHDLTTLSSPAFSVEHIMPKQWLQNWNDVSGEERINYRNFKLQTLGNLTIITKNLNSKLRNSGWENKKSILNEFSMVPLTTKYTSLEKWNENTIEQRAKDISALALTIWKK